MSRYDPPIQISPKILNLVAEISELLGRYAERERRAHSLRLRRANQIRTIHGSLAIEGNSLSVDQITAVLEGKLVIAPPREVQEVKNALAVYDNFHIYQPDKESDLLAAHEVLMTGLMDESGRYRSGGVGVMSGKEVIHMAPPANQVPRLMHDLFNWLQHTEHHPLVASAIFHYEFEFIHPFADGKGRMGRLWQSLISAKWNPLFANLPIESLVYANQLDYYQAIANSTAQTNSAPFVEFMLGVISQTLRQQILSEEQESTQDLEQRLESQLELRLESNLAAKVLLFIKDQPLSKSELAASLGHKSISGELNKQVKALLEKQWIQMTIPDKPTSRQQKYELTTQGKELLQQLSQ
ncbi:Fic family protein [Paenalcaligenes hominis]|uniref:Fic family protein n=1 Tax=Paenalcaligenes hominis TaxID=643674 RepID=UPI0035267CC2